MIPIVIMSKVYIFGPIHLFGQDYLPIYKKLNKVGAKYFDKVIGTYPDFWNSKESPRAFYSRTYRVITKCNLFIGEVSSPSHGVGMEFQMAFEHKIPIIAIAKQKAPVSSMILGLPNLTKLIRYKDENDLVKKLDKELVAYVSKNR
jgi:hypothetical protein